MKHSNINFQKITNILTSHQHLCKKMNFFLALKQLVHSINWLLSDVSHHKDPWYIFYIVLLMHLLIYIYVQIIRKEDTGHPREMIVKGWGPQYDCKGKTVRSWK